MPLPRLPRLVVRLPRPVFRLTPLRLALVVALAVVLLYYLGPAFLDVIELKTLDLKFQSRGPRKPGGEVAIVSIDEKSLDALGRWPWPRTTLARLIDALTQSGVRVIGFDIVFSEAEPRTDPALVEAIRRSGRVILGYFFFTAQAGLQHLTSADVRKGLEAAGRGRYPVVLQRAGQVDLQAHLRAYAADVNLPALADAALGIGYFNVLPDRDGNIRWYPLVFQAGDSYMAPLALQVLRAYLGGVQPTLHFSAARVARLALGPREIPTDDFGRLLINYAGPQRSFLHYSVADVLAGRVPPDALRDRIVLVGATAIGIYDMRVMPFGGDYPGVEVHANVVDNILHQQYLQRPGWAAAADIAAILILALALGLLLRRLRPLPGVGLAVAALVLWTYASYFAFTQGYWLSTVYPGLSVVLTYLGVTVYRFIGEEREKRVVKEAFQTYVAAAVVEEMLRDPGKLKLGGDKQVLTVLFSDIRGFTPVSERLAPELLVRLLNEYFTEMTDVIFRQEGLLDKYMGDAIMAVFGAPLPQPDHPVRACETALGMVEAIRRLHARWAAEGLPQLRARIGINTGPMVVGNMGSERRFEYTVVGDSVNLAARLEQLNNVYGTDIIIGEATREAVGGRFICRDLDLVRVKGKTEQVRVYELLGRQGENGAWRERIALFEAALQAYRQGQWAEALGLWEKLLALVPDDAPSQVFAERCRRLLREPPASWDPCWDATAAT